MVFVSPNLLYDVAQNRGTTAQEQCVLNVISEFFQRFRYFLLINESLHAFPFLLHWFVNWEVKIDFFVLLSVFFELIEEKNVVFSSVCKKKGQIGRKFELVFGYVLDDLVKGSDSGATGNHEKVMVLFFPGFFAKIKWWVLKGGDSDLTVFLVVESAIRERDVDFLVDLERV